MIKGQKERRAKGEGTFIDNMDGSVTLRKGIGFKPDGRRKTLTVTSSSRALALKEMRKKELEWEEEKARGKIQGSMLLGDFLRQDLKGRHGKIRARSYDRLECTIEKHVADYHIGMMQIQGLTKEILQKHLFELTDKHLSKSSVKKVYDAINSAFRRAIENGNVEKNPMIGVELPSDDYFIDKKYEKAKKKQSKYVGDVSKVNYRKEKAFGEDVRILDFNIDFWLLISESLKPCKNGKAKYPIGFAIILLLVTGMRVGELIALRWRDVNISDGIIEIYKSYGLVINRDSETLKIKKKVGKEDDTKTGKGRKIHVDEVGQWALKKLKSQSKYIVIRQIKHGFIRQIKTGVLQHWAVGKSTLFEGISARYFM